MALDYDKMMGLGALETRQTLTRRDTILYALGVGVGSDDPLAAATLRYVYEDGLQALPSMAVVLGYPGFWLKDPQYGLDWKKILHGEQSIELHRPLPVEGEILGRTRVDAIYDKGPGKGAILYSSREILDAATGESIATVRQSSFLRGDGGFGGSSEGAPKPHPVPGDRPPDAKVELAIRPDQALIYRLSGDYNPLHIDPAVAVGGGFERPILHGLCTYGFAGRAVLAALCDGDASRLRRLDVRFSSPVYPGETLQVSFWREGPGKASFVAAIPARGVTVLQNGYAEWT